MIAGLSSVTPSSKVGDVTRLTAFCASLPGPGHGCWTLLFSHCAEHICEIISNARVSNAGVFSGMIAVGSMVALLADSLVDVDFDKGVGVLVGADTTFTCTHI